jgi:hypothetical protein
MIVYSKASEYIASCTTVRARIAAIEAIQEALLITGLKAAENGDISQYSLNDGQTIIQTTYRTAGDIQKSYMSFETMKQLLINQLRGRMIRLVDRKNFRGYGY